MKLDDWGYYRGVMGLQPFIPRKQEARNEWGMQPLSSLRIASISRY